jgi:hypothetical protein
MKEKDISEWFDESSDVEYTTAADFEICDVALEFCKRLRDSLGNDCCNFMEESFRGFSNKMQYVMIHKIYHYLMFGTYTSTGVNHADELIEKIIQKMPKHVIDVAEALSLGVSIYALNKSNKDVAN